MSAERTVVLTVRLSPLELHALDVAAASVDRPRAYVVREALAPLFAAAPTPLEDHGSTPLPFE